MKMKKWCALALTAAVLTFGIGGNAAIVDAAAISEAELQEFLVKQSIDGTAAAAASIVAPAENAPVEGMAAAANQATAAQAAAPTTAPAAVTAAPAVAPASVPAVTAAGVEATYVDVNLTTQTMTYFVNGLPVLSSPCVTGNVSAGNGTPAGFFRIYNLVPGKYLTGPTWNVWVNYWMPFNGSIGLHDASWRGSFGGSIYQTNGSHGCVNLPSNVAATLYSMIGIGTQVVVHY